LFCREITRRTEDIRAISRQNRVDFFIPLASNKVGVLPDKLDMPPDLIGSLPDEPGVPPGKPGAPPDKAGSPPDQNLAPPDRICLLSIPYPLFPSK
jgi:hypothetical protein